MNVTFGAKLIADSKKLIRATDSPELQKNMAEAIAYAENFIKLPAVKILLGEDTVEFSRGEGRKFLIRANCIPKTGEIWGFDALNSYNETFPINKHSLANAMATIIGIKNGFSPRTFREASWLQALIRFWKENKSNYLNI